MGRIVINMYSLPVKRLFMGCLISSLFFSLFLVSVPVAVHCSSVELPASFYIQLQGQLQNENDTFLLVFSDGNAFTSKNMSLTFSVDRTSADKYFVHLSVNFGSFFNETTGNATISNGRLIIDSIPSIFFVSPALLTDGAVIQLYQTESRTLEGAVRKTGQPPTAIGDYRVTSKMVSAYLQSNSSGTPGGHLYMGFDPKTGVITMAAGQLSDILLDKMSIDFIQGGTFELISFSENLGFNLVIKSQSLIWGIVIISGIIAFCIFTLLVYKHNKKKTHRIIRTEKHRNLFGSKSEKDGESC